MTMSFNKLLSLLVTLSMVFLMVGAMPVWAEDVIDLNNSDLGQLFQDIVNGSDNTELTLGHPVGVYTPNATGGSALFNSGTATVTGVTLNGAPNADNSWPSYTVNNTGIMEITDSEITSYHGAVASYNDGAKVTLTNTDITMTGSPVSPATQSTPITRAL